MTNWQTIEPRGGARADQHIVTVAARRAGSERVGRPQLFVTLGAQVVRELGWKAGRALVQADPDECVMRIQPTSGRGSAQMGQRKDCAMLSLQVPTSGKLAPHIAEECEIWRDDGWLVMRIPAWAATGLREETRRALPTAPPAAPAPAQASDSNPRPAPGRASARGKVPTPAPATPRQPAPKPAPPAAPPAAAATPAPDTVQPPEAEPEPAPALTATAMETPAGTPPAPPPREPLGHSSGREDALRTAWAAKHLPIESVLKIVNAKTPSLTRFTLSGLRYYAEWLGLGPRPEQTPAPLPKTGGTAARAELLPRHKDRDEVEREFASGNRAVRQIATDFGLPISTISMWMFEWDKAQKKAAAA